MARPVGALRQRQPLGQGRAIALPQGELDVTIERVVKPGVHRCTSIKAAKACKVIENTQRDLNIALMNELAIIFDKVGIDTAKVLEAPGTKWNSLRFSPGLVSGHCIGVLHAE